MTALVEDVLFGGFAAIGVVSTVLYLVNEIFDKRWCL